MLRFSRAVIALATVIAALSGAQASAASSQQTFQIEAGEQAFSATLPANSVGTYVWHEGSGEVQSWITTPQEAESQGGLQPQSATIFGDVAPSLPTIEVDPEEEMQSLEGFGGAMTESAAFVIKGSQNGKAILEKLFAPPPAGAGFAVVRTPIGPSDFTVKPNAPAQYSKKQDEKYLVPELKEAWSIAGGIKILATPWSAPARMKIGKKLVGSGVCSGSNDYLNPADYTEYAKFLTAAVANYQKKGLPPWMLSLGNEPHNCNPTYPTMQMEPGDEATFSNVLYEQLTRPKNGLTGEPPQLLGWDHNWNECSDQTPATYPQELASLENHLSAIGFHSYCGEREPTVPQSWPQFDVTESTGFEGKPSASGNLPYEVQHDLIDPLRIGASSSLYWNLALNPGCGPQYGGTTCVPGAPSSSYSGCKDCRALITVQASGAYSLNQDYYYWAQFSKFLRPGARIIVSSRDGELDTIAARNPDGTIAVVVLNGAQPLPVGTHVDTPSDAELETAYASPLNRFVAVLTSPSNPGRSYVGYLGTDGQLPTEVLAIPTDINGMTFGPDGTAYVAIGGQGPGQGGQVITIAPDFSRAYELHSWGTSAHGARTPHTPVYLGERLYVDALAVNVYRSCEEKLSAMSPSGGSLARGEPPNDCGGSQDAANGQLSNLDSGSTNYSWLDPSTLQLLGTHSAGAGFVWSQAEGGDGSYGVASGTEDTCAMLRISHVEETATSYEAPLTKVLAIKPTEPCTLGGVAASATGVVEVAATDSHGLVLAKIAAGKVTRSVIGPAQAGDVTAVADGTGGVVISYVESVPCEDPNGATQLCARTTVLFNQGSSTSTIATLGGSYAECVEPVAAPVLVDGKLLLSIRSGPYLEQTASMKVISAPVGRQWWHNPA